MPRGQDGQGALAGLFGKKAVLPVSEQLPGAAQIMWKDRLAGRPGDLLDLVHLMGRHATAAEAREAGYAFRERQAEAEREAQAQRVSDRERRDFNAAAAPWAEALCRHYFPLGVKQDGRWRVRIIHGKKTYLMTAELSGAARGAWKLDETSNTGNLLLGLTGMQTVPACSIPLLGHGHVLWEDKLAGKPGDLLDIVLIREHCRTTAEAMAAGRAFLEGEIKARLEGKHEAQRQLNTALAPHAEALCRRFLPEGVKINGRWRVRLVHREAEYAMNVELSGPERGSWTLKATSGHGALLDIVHKGMTAARALLEDETRPMYVEVIGPGQAMWKDKMAGEPGNLLNIVHIKEHCRTTAEAMAAARAFLEGEHEAQRQLAAELSPHAEAVCRRYLARGVKQDGQWRVRTVQDDKACSMTVELEGPARGTWKNEATGEQGNLFDIVHGRGDKHNDITVTMEAARAFLHGEHEARRQLAAELAPHAEVLCRRYLPDSVKLYRQWRVLTVQSENEYSMTVELKGPARGTWKDEITGRQGDLLDLIRIGGKHHDGIAATMAAGRAFLETQAEVQRQLDAKLEPHAEALCQSYLPRGVEQDGQWREERVTVELEGPARGTWKDEITGRQGGLLDLIRIEGAHFDNITAAMAAAHTFLHGEAQAALRNDWKAHDTRALEAGNPLYHTPEYHQLIGRTQDLVQAYTTLRDPHSFFTPQYLEQRIAAHQAHLEASAPLKRHADAVRAHEQHRREQLGLRRRPPRLQRPIPPVAA